MTAAEFEHWVKYWNRPNVSYLRRHGLLHDDWYLISKRMQAEILLLAWGHKVTVCRLP